MVAQLCDKKKGAAISQELRFLIETLKSRKSNLSTLLEFVDSSYDYSTAALEISKENRYFVISKASFGRVGGLVQQRFIETILPMLVSGFMESKTNGDCGNT